MPLNHKPARRAKYNTWGVQFVDDNGKPVLDGLVEGGPPWLYPTRAAARHDLVLYKTMGVYPKSARVVRLSVLVTVEE